MSYLELTFIVNANEEFYRDLLIDSLSETGFDTFEETDTGFKAYIPQHLFDQDITDRKLAGFSYIDFSYSTRFIPEENWNEVWESNFEPLVIGQNCYVRATFHEPHPEYPYEIIIDPKMSFGTGHHQTTAQMIEYMLADDFSGKRVLDMGCGTAILGILASKLGATEIVAIDYDPLCYSSTIENAQLNGVSNLEARLGSKEAIPDAQYDIILANINRNILLDQISSYSNVLTEGGHLYLSGFYETPDLDLLKEESIRHNLTYINHTLKDDWVAAYFVKK